MPIPADNDARSVHDDDACLQLFEKLEILNCQAQKPRAAARGAMDPGLLLSQPPIAGAYRSLPTGSFRTFLESSVGQYVLLRAGRRLKRRMRQPRHAPEGRLASGSPPRRTLLYPSRPWARSSTVEHLTLNQRVLGSNPSGLTRFTNAKRPLSEPRGGAVDCGPAAPRAGQEEWPGLMHSAVRWAHHGSGRNGIVHSRVERSARRKSTLRFTGWPSPCGCRGRRREHGIGSATVASQEESCALRPFRR